MLLFATVTNEFTTILFNSPLTRCESFFLSNVAIIRTAHFKYRGRDTYLFVRVPSIENTAGLRLSCAMFKELKTKVCNRKDLTKCSQYGNL